MEKKSKTFDLTSPRIVRERRILRLKLMSLKQLLGSGKDKKAKVDKVAVVIDPRLTKVLRPHQVEGVKVSP